MVGLFDLYIRRIGTGEAARDLTNDVVQQINSVLVIVVKKLSARAGEFAKSREARTVTAEDVQSAVKSLLPGELGRIAVNEGKFVVTEFKEEGRTRAIVFPVGRVARLMRESTCVDRLAKTAPMYLSGVLAYLCSGMLEEAGYVAKSQKKHRVIVHHLYLAVESNVELHALMKQIGVCFAGGGVVPSFEGRAKKPALQDIKRQQKTSDCLVFGHLPTDRYVREASQEFTDRPLRFSADGLTLFQHSLERHLTALLHKANQIAAHAGRQRVTKADIQLARSVADELVSKAALS